MGIAQGEAEKYRDIWTFPQYAQHSPGAEAATRFQRVIGGPQAWHSDATVFDFGCGAGAGTLALARLGFAVYGWDLVDVRTADAKAAMRDFIEGPLWRPCYQRGVAFGYCVDVMEHIPPEFTMLSVTNMLEHCGTLYLEIANDQDQFGALIGQPLHLTVQPFTWWRDRLSEISTVLDARDLMGKSAFLVEAAR